MTKPWRDADLLSGKTPNVREDDYARAVEPVPQSWLDWMDAQRAKVAALGSMTAPDYGPFPFSDEDYCAVAQHPTCQACGAEVEHGERLCVICERAGEGSSVAAAIAADRIEQAQGWRP